MDIIDFLGFLFNTPSHRQKAKNQIECQKLISKHIAETHRHNIYSTRHSMNDLREQYGLERLGEE